MDSRLRLPAAGRRELKGEKQFYEQNSKTYCKQIFRIK